MKPLIFISTTILSFWLVLVLIGKRGLVHVLLLNGLAIAFVVLVRYYRSRLSDR